MVDILIVGGGPAGMTAGLYAARAGFSALLLEGELIGGQASTTDMLENYPGFPDGIGGPELMMSFSAQAERAGLTIEYAAVTKLDLAGDIKRVEAGVKTYEARAVILCMGAARRRLGVPGETEHIGRGVSYCATCDGAIYRGKRAAVVGGGNTAVEDALYLARGCSEVLVIHRRDEFRAKGKDVELLRNTPNVKLLLSRTVERIEKSEDSLTLSVKRLGDNALEQWAVSAVFISVGTDPNTALIKGQIDLDDSGYLLAGEDTKTNLSGVFAAGDLRKKPLRQVITAAADGATAAHQAGIYLESLQHG